MIQDINPSKLYNSYENKEPSENDIMLGFDETGKLYAKITDDALIFIPCSEADGHPLIYLFSIDDTGYYLAFDMSLKSESDGYKYHSIRELRDLASGKELFAAFTAYHLWKWYDENRFCGRCGERLILHDIERALRCPGCGNIIYPRINPAVIVAVTNGNKLLITRYQRGYKHNALVAGFTEIGETIEETVSREVMEETGLHVKNIRYYKSQPWGMAQDLLLGFFCEVDGDPTIHMDEGELKFAEWVEREDIELQPNNLSLTNEMMTVFKENK